MDIPVTTAIRALRAAKADFEPCAYDYVEHGGTDRAAEELGIDEHSTVKTIVMETDAKKPFIVLMHGDREISTKQMARVLGVKSVAPCLPDTATRHTGYLVGGTSPFGTRKPLPVYAERTLFDLPEVYINGGRRGLLVKIAPGVIERLLHPVRVDAAVPKHRD
jgi:Cys-tRNA(Pro) deacylase